MVVAFWLSVVFLAVQLLILLTNILFFPVLVPAPSYAKGVKKVSLLVPARNEAENLSETLPRLLAQAEATEVIVLNDQSSDDTATVLARFKEGNPHLKVVQGQDLPEAWTGKNWACQQLSEAASGDILVFTDADVLWEKKSLAALLSFQEKHEAAFVSVWPRQITVSTLETIVVPLIDQILLGSLPYLGVKYSKHKALSAGNGQVMLWTQEAYKVIGGHAAFKQELLEDVRMGQAAKGAGLKLALAVGANMISTRMYKSNEALIEGFSKNILAASGNKLVLIGLALLNTLAHSLSWLFIAVNPQWLIVGLMSLTLRALTNLKTKQDPMDTFWQPFISLPLGLIVTRALRQKTITWKGRQYP